MNITDKRNTLKKHAARVYKKRLLSDITSIAIHHSATLQGSSEAFARYHVTHNGWPGIGYTYVINKDGSIDWCNDWNLKTAHVGNSNKNALGVCLVGDFTKEKPTELQLQSAADLCMMLIDKIESIKSIKGHSEYPDYNWKLCPAFDVKEITCKMSVFNNIK